MKNIGKFKYAFGGHLKGEESPSGLYLEYMEYVQQSLGVHHMGKCTERLRHKVIVILFPLSYSSQVFLSEIIKYIWGQGEVKIP